MKARGCFDRFAETASRNRCAGCDHSGNKVYPDNTGSNTGCQIFIFSEAHSHATEQKLVKDDIDRVINDIDRIVFIEDEVTTGNTIMNIIKIITKEYQEKNKICSCFIVKWNDRRILKNLSG